MLHKTALLIGTGRVANGMPVKSEDRDDEMLMKGRVKTEEAAWHER